MDRTALQWAAANGHTEIMQLLIKYGADIEAQDKVGEERGTERERGGGGESERGTDRESDRRGVEMTSIIRGDGTEIMHLLMKYSAHIEADRVGGEGE